MVKLGGFAQPEPCRAVDAGNQECDRGPQSRCPKLRLARAHDELTPGEPEHHCEREGTDRFLYIPSLAEVKERGGTREDQ